MPDFLFVFGYESPEEHRVNHDHGTDLDSSNAAWITAIDEDSAMLGGRVSAESWAGALFLRPFGEGWADGLRQGSRLPYERLAGPSPDVGWRARRAVESTA